MNRQLLVGVLCLGLAACGPSDEERAQQEAEELAENMRQAARELRESAQKSPENIEEAMGQLAEAFGGEAVESVPAQSLKDLLPESWPDMKRVRISANKNGAMGFTVSNAEADYKSLDDQSNATMMIKISDIGSMQGFARMGLSWLDAEVSEETEDGFNRTTQYKGHRAMENFETRGSGSTASKVVFVDSRFLIEIEVVDLPFETIDEVLDTIPVDALSALANVSSH